MPDEKRSRKGLLDEIERLTEARRRRKEKRAKDSEGLDLDRIG